MNKKRLLPPCGQNAILLLSHVGPLIAVLYSALEIVAALQGKETHHVSHPSPRETAIQPFLNRNSWRLLASNGANTGVSLAGCSSCLHQTLMSRSRWASTQKLNMTMRSRYAAPCQDAKQMCAAPALCCLAYLPHTWQMHVIMPCSCAVPQAHQPLHVGDTGPWAEQTRVIRGMTVGCL